MAAGAALALAVNYGLQGAFETPEPVTASSSELPPEFGRLGEAWELLQREHIDRSTLDATVLARGAIRGMLDALDDPYASYLEPQRFGEEESKIQGVFEGIGAQVGIREEQLTVIAPLPDTPAERAGIRAGDVILEVDGEATENLSLQEAVSRIRGRKGTTVELLVLHANENSPVLIPITRGEIPLETVRFTMLDDGIGHLQISSFATTTNGHVNEALQEFRESNGRGLIVDLRYNPGGLLGVVVDVTSQFLDEGLVTYELDGLGSRREWKVSSGGNGRDIPLVVLVNQYSASASEVFAGAIIDHDRAPVVGEPTFGKGSVNTRHRLSDGSGLYYTIARWYTPDGTLIEGSGITPTILVEADSESGSDPQLDKAVELLGGRAGGSSRPQF
jgi:carboxyl-terminal processing protease